MLQGCFRLSVVCDVCIVAKRYVLEQKLYWQRIGSRMWGIDCYQNEWPWPLFRGRLRSSRHIRCWISRKPLGDRPAWFQSHCRLMSLQSAEVSTIAAVTSHCLKMRVKHWSRRSSPVAWTTATLWSACRKAWWTGCIRFRTLSPV